MSNGVHGQGITQDELRALIAALNSRDLHLSTGTEREAFKGEAAALASVTKKFIKDFERRITRFALIADDGEREAAVRSAFEKAATPKRLSASEREIAAELQRKSSGAFSKMVRKQSKQAEGLRRVFRQVGASK